MKQFLFFFFFIISLNSFSQSDPYAEAKISAKLYPMAFYPGYAGPSVRMSLEYRIKNNISLENQAGLFFYYSKGYTAALECKYYTGENKLIEGRYFSAEFFYKNQSYNRSDSIGAEWKVFSVSKNVECLTFKYGNLKIYDSGFVFDAFAGLGVRFQQNTNTLSAEENAEINSSSAYRVYRILHQAGNKVYPNFVASIKIGWRIKG
jgi:hypothetical protein